MMNSKAKHRCIVLMSFAPKYQEVYEQIYHPVCAANDVGCKRADEIVGPGSIIKDIVEEIIEADIIIADLTTRNANVFYELGIAHYAGNKTIMISQSRDDVPFDIASNRVIFYEQTISGSEDLRRKLDLAIKELLKHQGRTNNPVQDVLSKRLASPLASVRTLNKRIEMPKPVELAKEASEICILAVSAHYALAQYMTFYENKLRDGCNMRIILLNPESTSLEIWKKLSHTIRTESHIEQTLARLEKLSKMSGMKGTCKTHLTDILFPYSMFAVDMDKESGSMVVEYYAYQVNIDARPHIQLSASNNTEWFDFYKQQFEQAWVPPGSHSYPKSSST